jgi:glucose/arabinose dehydrogenase
MDRGTVKRLAGRRSAQLALLALTPPLAFAALAPACGAQAPSAAADAAGPAPGATDAAFGPETATPDGPAPKPAFFFEEIALADEPLAVTEFRFIPGTGELLILDKVGKVRHYALGASDAKLLGSFDVPGVFSGADCGLVSMAFDPGYQVNGRVYFGYCTSALESRISRHTFQGGDYAAAAPGVEILSVGHPEAPEPWHNVGSIGFDGDQNLWAVFGDKVVSASAQDLSSNLGSLVRIVPGEEGGYTAAAGNPFVGEADRSEAIYAYGLRSPWRASLDSRGRYWIGDVGEATYEELSLVKGPGENLGWPTFEGPCDGSCQGTTPPLVYWDRSATTAQAKDDPETPETSRRVVWVGPEYRSATDRYAGALTGRVLYGDFCAGWVRAIEANDAGAVVEDQHLAHLEGVVSWDVGPDGYLYAATYGSCFTFPYERGRLFRFKRR